MEKEEEEIKREYEEMDKWTTLPSLKDYPDSEIQQISNSLKKKEKKLSSRFTLVFLSFLIFPILMIIPIILSIIYILYSRRNRSCIKEQDADDKQQSLNDTTTNSTPKINEQSLTLSYISK